MHVTYLGPHDAVEIPALTDVVVERDETIEVDDDFGARLVEQGVWDAPADEILAWVGDDVDRARLMWRAEADGQAHRAEVLAALVPLVEPSDEELARVAELVDEPIEPKKPKRQRRATGESDAAPVMDESAKDGE